MQQPNALFQGENLSVLREHFDDESVDLTYLDPPFNSGTVYGVTEAQPAGERRRAWTKAFADVWRWNAETTRDYGEAVRDGGAVAALLGALRTALGDDGMTAYLSMMAIRLVELRRVLRATGSVFLHCDPTASHYLKLLMDAIFGVENFRNEIVWSYGGRGAKAVSRQFPRNHDVLLFYSKSAGEHVYHRQYVERRFTTEEAKRRGFRHDGSGWFKTAPRGDYTDTSIAALRVQGRVHRTRTGSLRVKYALASDATGVVERALLGDVWSDVPDAMHLGGESTGYPTQKPLALLRRIVTAASKPGDVVLDPFCGSGTALVAAEELDRRWFGIDAALPAVALVRQRMERAHSLFGHDYAVVGA